VAQPEQAEARQGQGMVDVKEAFRLPDVKDTLYKHPVAEAERQLQYAEPDEEKPKGKVIEGDQIPVLAAEIEKSVIESGGEPIGEPKKFLMQEKNGSPVMEAVQASVPTLAEALEATGVIHSVESGTVSQVIAETDTAQSSFETSVEVETISGVPDQLTSPAIDTAVDEAQALAVEGAPEAQVFSGTVSHIIEAFASNMVVTEAGPAELEPIITALEFLPEATHRAIGEYLDESELEEIVVLQEMLVSMAPVLKRYETLILEASEESPEAEQIEAIIMEWYEEVMRSVDEPIESQKTAIFIENLKEKILLNKAARERSDDSGTHEHKFGLPNLQTARKITDGIERQLGRLTVQGMAPRLVVA
jgi:hypothetical protein